MAARRARGAGSVFRRATGGYVYKWVDDTGKTRWESLRTKNRKTALERAKGYEDAKNAQDRNAVLIESARLRKIIGSKPVPLGKTWSMFTATKPTGSPGTLTNYRRALERFTTWLREHAPDVDDLGLVTVDMARDFLADVWRTGVTANRYNYIRGALRLVTGAVLGRDAENPFAATDRKADPARKRQRRRALTGPQVKALLALVDDAPPGTPFAADMPMLFRLGLFCGMREKDAALLRWSSVDLADGRIRYVPYKTRGKDIEAVVPLLPALAAALAERWAERTDADCPYVLPDIAAEYLRGTKAVEKEAVRLVHAVTGGDGREDPTEGAPQRKRVRSPYGYHSCRHTFCSALAQRGVPLARTALMTGDSEATVSRFYVHAEAHHDDLNGAFGPMLALTEGTTTDTSARTRLAALIERMTEAEAAAALSQIEKGTRS